MAAEPVSREVDVISAQSDTSALAAKTVTSTIPIVFIVGADPVAAGLVPGLARPGGNLTGVGLFTVELNAKRIELVSELVPQVAVIALLVNPNYSTTEPITVPPLILARANEVIE
jgi:putative tryptophan/tyrosine transport system substrate-binding protein